ncbi:ATP-dependent DNA ligase [Streptomyces sp. LX-29]|uniref:ATP-dependent DNA ligase n=1 Tax=Streptomyces sp. LX-29 TaxID=2900152 RepID=UPI00240E13C0|nr:ATP-dependent DNA ligase [Streptomyces sp. LX-29]WFB11618.1 ATP-dependent DNA ligase [Streptomyces sp. LX-29]
MARPIQTFPAPAAGRRLAYEPKFDGHRVLIFRTEEEVLLQARSGRIITRAFPDLVTAALRLPAGVVLDGEVVVWTEGRTDFAAVQQRAAAPPARAARLARRRPASYAAFDLLAAEGRDLRPRPYDERRAALVALLEPHGPPIQPVPMTTDRGEAAEWYESLRAVGVEGLVVKGLAQPYRAGRYWLKLRHSDTRDAVVVGVVGPRYRPRALALALPGDDTPVVSTPLDAALRARLAEPLRRLQRDARDGAAAEGAEADRDAEAATDGAAAPEFEAPEVPEAIAHDMVGAEVAYRPVPPELTVEVRADTTPRHAAVTVIRLRAPD